MSFIVSLCVMAPSAYSMLCILLSVIPGLIQLTFFRILYSHEKWLRSCFRQTESYFPDVDIRPPRNYKCNRPTMLLPHCSFLRGTFLSFSIRKQNFSLKIGYFHTAPAFLFRWTEYTGNFRCNISACGCRDAPDPSF